MPKERWMGQISRPIQVLLAVTVLFAAAWFLALRPKSDSGEPASAPSTSRQAATPFGRAVDRARTGADQATADAAGAANATADGAGPGSRGPVATGGSSAASPTGTTGARPAAGAGALPRRLARALDARRVVVLLFWNRAASDDRAVRAELRQVSRRGGRVVVAAAPLSQLARYGAITRGVQVLRSPTLVVVDRRRRATTLSGYTDAPEIDQTISDVLSPRAARAG
jgi:hypothetical protein